MKNRKKNKLQPLLILVFILLVVGCKRDNNYTGHSYFPDMAYSYAYESYGASTNFSDSISMMYPVEGTVPRGMIPYQYEKTFDDQMLAGQELTNPFEPTKENLQRGKEQYDIYCTLCHGDQGKGDGHLFTSKLFPVQPTSLVGDYVQKKADGEIYHVITLGSLSGLMGAHGSQIKPDDRWKIVAYVRNGFNVK